MKTSLMVLVLIVGVAVSGCKKKTTPVVTNTLCDGITRDSWFPLKLHNVWQYSLSNGGYDEQIEFHDTTVLNTFTYYLTYGIEYYANAMLREDAATHDIYINDFRGEMLEIPGSPVLNQAWNYYGEIRKVTNTNASISTSSCNYAGCLEITQYSSSNMDYKLYFKRKLGLVYYLKSDGSNYKLNLAAIS